MVFCRIATYFISNTTLRNAGKRNLVMIVREVVVEKTEKSVCKTTCFPALIGFSRWSYRVPVSSPRNDLLFLGIAYLVATWLRTVGIEPTTSGL